MNKKPMKEIINKLNALAVISNEERFKILLALYISDVLKWGPEFKEEKKKDDN